MTPAPYVPSISGMTDDNPHTERTTPMEAPATPTLISTGTYRDVQGRVRGYVLVSVYQPPGASATHVFARDGRGDVMMVESRGGRPARFERIKPGDEVEITTAGVHDTGLGPRSAPLYVRVMGDQQSDHHAETLALLHQIRDVLTELVTLTRERNAPANPFGSLLSEAIKAGMAKTASASPHGTWLGDIETVDVDGERDWLKAAGVFWRWQSSVRAVAGPMCPGLTRVPMVYQPSLAAGTTMPAADSVLLGSAGWLVCPDCGLTAAVASIGVSVGAIRAAVDAEFRRRLGLGAR